MFNLGQKVTLPRGRKGERPDFYVGTIVSQPRLEQVGGRIVEIADVITAEKTLAGEWRLALNAVQNLRFVFPARRADADAEAVLLIDGPAHQPKTAQELLVEQAQAAMAYLESRPASVAEMSLDDIAD
jgi:hypothetical protein